MSEPWERRNPRTPLVHWLLEFESGQVLDRVPEFLLPKGLSAAARWGEDPMISAAGTGRIVPHETIDLTGYHEVPGYEVLEPQVGINNPGWMVEIRDGGG